MAKLIDLHTHSTFSDGALSPSELIDLAKKSNIGTLSLTDHDTLAGVYEVQKYGLLHGIEVIPGIEMSAVHENTTMHMLGYGVNSDNLPLNDIIEKVQQSRKERNLEIIKKLRNMGKDINTEELPKKNNQQIGRPHIASLLVHKGYAKNIDEAFRRYLRDGGPAYVEGHKLSAAETITTITRAGGLAVLAHPAKIDLSVKKLKQLIADLTGLGLTGIEVYYPRHSIKDIKKLKKLALDNNLLVTGGSDFHGLGGHGDILGCSKRIYQLPHDAWLDFKARLNGSR